MINRLKLVVTLAILFLISKVDAATPPWTVNPNAFQYSLTFTTVVNADCKELKATANLVGAFVGTDCRGVVYTSNVVNGRFIAYVTVFSNAASGETVRFKFYDAAKDSVYDAKDTIIFQENATYGYASSPYTLISNHTPTQIGLSNLIVAENLSIGSVVGNLSTTDIDVTDTHTYTLVSGTGSTNNSMFSISGNQLLTNATFDFNQQNSLSIRIKSNDGHGCEVENIFMLQVQNINDLPTNISLSDTVYFENQPSLTQVATLSSTDADLTDTHIYALVNGVGATDNSFFTIAGNQLKALTTFNYEAKNTYNIRLKTTDNNGGAYEEAFVIYIADNNDAPTALALSNNKVYENLSQNTLIGTLTSTDEDAGAGFNYTFSNVPGNDNSSFQLVGDELRTGQIYDFETKNLYVIYIQTSDGQGGTFTKQFSIQIKDTLDTPTDMMISNAVLFENKPAGEFIGEFTTIDVNNSGTLYTYTLVNGTGALDNSSFAIVNDSLVSNASFDYESKNAYSIRVRATLQNGMYTEKAFAINVLDASDGITDLTLSNNYVNENELSIFEVGAFTPSSQDAGLTYTYTLVAGAGDADNAKFSIMADKLKTQVSFNFETQDTLYIRAKVTDNNNASYEKAFIVIVVNQNDVPTAIALSNNKVYENANSNVLVGTLTSTDEDVASTFTYMFVNTPGNDNTSFQLVGNELRTAQTFDFETKNLYVVYVQTSDGQGGMFTKQFSVEIKDTLDSPNDMMIGNSSVLENKAIGELVGEFTTVDANNSTPYTYSLVAGVGATDNSAFTILNDSLLSNVIFDYELKNSYSIRVRSTLVNGLYFEKVFTINILDGSDGISNISITNSIVDENKPANTQVGEILVTSQDVGATYTYSLVAGAGDTDNAKFVVDANKVILATTANYENQAQYSIRVKVENATASSFEKVFVINVNDVNEAPVAFDDAITVAENTDLNKVLSTVKVTDVDVKNTGDNYTFTLINTDNAPFAIDPITGEVKLNGMLNYETTKEYKLKYVVKDWGLNALTDTANVIIHVKDVIEDALPYNNYVSPNNDGKNDKFVIVNADLYKDYELSIYNEGGIEVLKTNNYQNDWDGENLSSGVYFFVLKNSSTDNVYKGHINLIK